METFYELACPSSSAAEVVIRLILVVLTAVSATVVILRQ